MKVGYWVICLVLVISLNISQEYSVPERSPVSNAQPQTAFSVVYLMQVINDSDGDGLSDEYELAHYLDPNNPDTDGDGCSDGQEVQYGTNATLPEFFVDYDNDGVDNPEECQYGTNPFNSDTDGDKLPDRWEIDWSFNPLEDVERNLDNDSDQLSTLLEFLLDTNPFDADTDKDGLDDGFEYLHGFDPLDPEDPWSESHSILYDTGWMFLMLSVFGSAVYYNYYTRNKAMWNAIQLKTFSNHVRLEMKNIFSQSVLYYSLIGQSRIDKDFQGTIKQITPKNLMKHKFLFHPIRLTFLKLIFESVELSSIEAKSTLELTWNEYYSHLNMLKKKGFIEHYDDFVGGNVRQMVKFTEFGMKMYRELIDLLHLFLDSTVNYQSYIAKAQKKIDFEDVNLYPKSDDDED